MNRHILTTSSSSDDLLSPREAAALIPGTTAATLRRWARAGKVPAVVLPSKRMLFRREDVLALLTPTTGPAAASSPADESPGDEMVTRGQAMLSWPGTPQPSPASPAAAGGVS